VTYSTKSMRIGKKTNAVVLITKNSDENYNSQTNY